MDCPLELKIARIDVTDMFVDDYEVAGGDREIGECLAQHYLSTSDGLDFSASLGVALAFALGEKEEDIHRTAYVAVLNRARTDISNRFRLRDLRELRDALRPVRQHGFVAVHEAGNFIDLKAADCRNELGLEWYSFNVAPGDVCKQRHPKAPNLDALYDIRGDQWAARMIEHLSDQVRFPSPQWGQLGHRHLIDTLSALLSRNKS
jgi:hypothetical protein